MTCIAAACGLQLSDAGGNDGSCALAVSKSPHQVDRGSTVGRVLPSFAPAVAQAPSALYARHYTSHYVPRCVDPGTVRIRKQLTGLAAMPESDNQGGHPATMRKEDT
jgi:hypothetical protein